MTLYLSSLARDELQDSIDFYEKERSGLGQRFSQHIQRALKEIEQNPLLYPQIEKGIRRQVLLDFPYSIFYHINDLRKIIVIISIAHQHRKPIYLIDKEKK